VKKRAFFLVALALGGCAGPKSVLANLDGLTVDQARTRYPDIFRSKFFGRGNADGGECWLVVGSAERMSTDESTDELLSEAALDARGVLADGIAHAPGSSVNSAHTERFRCIYHWAEGTETFVLCVAPVATTHALPAPDASRDRPAEQQNPQ
jgi:hypothetical protein